MRQILIKPDKFAVVDDEDYEWLNQWKWHLNRGYVTTTMSMHQLVCGSILKGHKRHIDHINGCKNDNRRCNLRICTPSQNHANQKKQKGRWTSQYKGVIWDKSRKKWRATIFVNGKHKYLGRFTNEKDAAIIYNKMAEKYFGEFARLNFLGDEESMCGMDQGQQGKSL